MAQKLVGSANPQIAAQPGNNKVEDSKTQSPQNPPQKTKTSPNFFIVGFICLMFFAGVFFLIRFLIRPAFLNPIVQPIPSPEINTGVSPSSSSAAMPVSELTPTETEILNSAYSGFGIRFLQNQFKTQPKTNIFISPVSLEIAFSMAMMGAEPTVQKEMSTTLGFGSQSNDTIRTLSKKYLTAVATADPDITISIANSIWTQLTAKINPDFLAVNREAFAARIESLDLTKIVGIATVNKWVSDQTRGKIEQILTEPLNRDQIMALINAVYFKGNWTTPFEKSKTQDRQFTATDGTSIRAPFMEQSDSFMYLENVQFQAIQLPYGTTEKWRMYLFLPKSNLASFMNSLTVENWVKWQSGFEFRSGTIRLPKFKSEYNMELSNIMKALGMKLAFEMGNRFPGIANLVWIERGIHKTYVDVNEEGTEATAVTALIPVAGGGSEEPPFTMTLDHPFLYAIVDGNTNIIVFMGVMQKPE